MSGILVPIPSDWTSKSPGDRRFYAISFQYQWGQYPDDEIASIVSVTCSPGDLIVDAPVIGPSTTGQPNQSVGFWLTEGSVPSGQQSRLYTVTVAIVSAAGQELTRSSYLRVQNR